jgi:hypothetical protein
MGLYDYFPETQAQQPDVIGQYLRGAFAPGQLQGQQQQLQEGALNIQQLKMALQGRQMQADSWQGAMQPTLGGHSGGVQDGPQTQTASAYPVGNSGPGFSGRPNLTPPPSPATVAAVNGMGVSPQMAQYLQGVALQGGNTAEAQHQMQENQIQRMQVAVQPYLNQAENVISSANPERLIMNNPAYMQLWQQNAPKLGLDPSDPKTMTPENVRAAATLYYNDAAGSAKLPPKGMPQHFTDVVGPNGAFGQRDDSNNKLTMDSRAPMLDEYRFAQSQGFKGSFIDFTQLKSRASEDKPPSGYQWSGDGTLAPIKGGPADKSGLDSRSGLMFQRVLSSANEATTSLKNIMELPAGASTGVLGVGSSPGHSVMDSIKGNLTNRLASQDVQDYNSMIAGVSRNLSTIESAGLAPNGTLTHSMESVTLRDGDTELTKLRKMAEARQIIEKGIETNLDNPKLPQQQRDAVNKIISDVQTAIPFTHHDITQLQQAQKSNPTTTMNDLVKQKGLSGGHPPDIQNLLDKYK